MRISEMQKRLKEIDVWQLMRPILEQSTPEIVRLNKEQLREGKTSKDQNMREYSTDYYEFKKTLPTYKADPYTDLYKTGAFHDGFYATVKNEGVEIGSTDTKESMLEEDYGKDIFKLTSKNLSGLKVNWTMLLVKSIRSKI
jgi:hypothetical protein